MIKRSGPMRFDLVGIVVIAAVVLAGAGASSASALSPWWHLNTGSAPAILRPGQAEDEVQELTVSATGGQFVIFEPEAFAREELINGKGEQEFAFFEFDAQASVVQAGLEGIYGSGSVEVGGGPGDENGTKPYVIRFLGQRVPLINASASGSFLSCAGATGAGCTQKATVKEVTVGRSDGQLVVTAANLGDADLNGSSTPMRIADKLPAGLRAVAIRGEADGSRNTIRLECSLASLSCSFTGTIPPYEDIRMFISVDVGPGAKPGEANEVVATGGNSRPATVTHPISSGAQSTPFGVENYEMTPEMEGGATETQAGSHPFQLTTTLKLNRSYDEPRCAEEGCNFIPTVPELAKDLNFRLPPGLVGNPTPFPQCTLAQFLRVVTFTNECANDTVLGVANVKIALRFLGEREEDITAPLFNLTPSVGEPARFGFEVLGVPVYLDTAVRTGEDYGVTVKVSNITQTATFLDSRVTFWGVPGDARHDDARGWSCLGDGVYFGGGILPCAPTEPHTPPPFLELPTSCTGPLQTAVEADSWPKRGSFTSFGPGVPLPSLDGCNALPFGPSIQVTPDSQAGSTPTGLTVGVHVPQEVSLDAEGLGEADVKNTRVALPAGIGLNPAAADGLQSCSESQVSLNTPGDSSCPESSKVGLVKIKTPLLPDELEGAAYLAAQDKNPFGSLVALYVFAQDPVSGATVKLAGEVVPDSVTGQLVSTFKDTPQLPFERFELHFFGGDRAPLSTPSLCGAYTTAASIEPWTETGEAGSSSTFDVVSGPNGSPCHDPLPFSPSLTAGTTSIQAGGFTPFTMTMSRPDGSQNLQAITLKMPPGLLGTLAKVRLCPDAQASTGTCGPESLIGHTTVSVGVGGDPYTVVGGEVFITEGYEGAPYGLSIVNPAKAGPYDLGKVIVRAKIEVDPITAALTVTTDTTGSYKIPTILDGIPLQIQHVNVSIDRPGFTFNPTNCSPLQIGGSLTSDQGAVQTLSVPFQITNCAVLAFKPRLTAKTNGKTSRANGASLSVKLTYPAGPFDANISKVKVDLPKQLPSRLTTLQKACPAKTFEANPAACPTASIVGHAKATTPVLPVGLEGPAYFVSHGGEEFPQLIIVLQGYGTTVHLVGSTFISKAGVTSSTFKQVPDVPVGTFELTLPQGKFSALAANGNLCTTKKLAMPTSFVAQNGVVINKSTPIVPTGCAKKAQKAGKHKRTAHGKKK